MPPQSSYPNITVRAEAMNLFVAAFDVFPSLAHNYLVQRGFARQGRSGRLEPSQKFIPLDAWIGTFTSVLADMGPNALFKIGEEVRKNPNFPDTVHDLEGALRSIDVAYHMSHRRSGAIMYDRTTGRMLEGIGHYMVERAEKEKRIVVECDTPYPCPLEHGMISGIVAQFEPRAIVTHDEPQRCRLKAADRCAYLVAW